MTYQLRPYQKDASLAAVEAFKKGKNNGLLVLPTGSGKSLVLADIAAHLDSPLLVFCPSKEILEQNYEKMMSYNLYDVGIYSASVGKKDIMGITLATIGSVNNHLEDFRSFKYVAVDEAHQVNSKGGMYERFIHDREDRVVIGLTATPYRLSTSSFGAELKFLTRTNPRIFTDVLYYCQVSDMVAMGYLAKIRYIDLTSKMSFKRDNVSRNSTGADYNEKSLMREYERSRFRDELFIWTRRVLKPKDGSRRNGVLVFTSFVKEADYLSTRLNSVGIRSAIVSGDTPKNERESILKRFKNKEIEVVCNCGVLTTGFDFPALDTVIMARPTMSLSLYYQIVGRCIRPYPNKDTWFIDLCGNYQNFGKVEDLKLWHPPVKGKGYKKWMIISNGRQLTNKPF